MDQGTEDLGTRARGKISKAHSEEQLFVSTISFWEIGMLIEKGRLEFAHDLSSWRVEMLSAGLNEIPVDGSIAIYAAEMKNFHGDPADRIIVATSKLLGTRLATADRRILDYRPARTINGRK
jgi:PIN domain nuclease of toxin-antitoxin system